MTEKIAEGEIVGQELAIILDEQGVSADNKKALIEAFGGPFVEAGDILANYKELEVTDVTQIKEMAEAREKRLALRKARITVENKRKELKEDSLKTGRVIDAVARFVKDQIEPAEKYLEQQEKFKQLKEEAERAQRLTARTEAIAKFTGPTLYQLDVMAEDTFQELLIKLDHEAVEKVEAERKVEEERVAHDKAERERQAQIAEENKRLQREAEEQRVANERKIERVNAVTALGMVWSESLQAYKLDDLQITNQDITELNIVKFKILLGNVEKKVSEQREAVAAAERAAQAERDAELAKQREAAEEERKKREELEKAEAERKAAEEKSQREAEEAQRQSLLAPDKDKIKAIIPKLVQIKSELPATKETAAQDLVRTIDTMLDKAVAFIEEKVEAL